MYREARLTGKTLVLKNIFSAAVCLFLFCTGAAKGADSKMPAIGDKAQEFELPKVDGTKVKLKDALQDGPVVLMVLRGFPGYQCPLCTAQVGTFLNKAKDFADLKTKIILVYPGPEKNLAQRAQEFLKDTKLLENVEFLLDPDYVFTNAYQLRWDQPKETAYPSTFVIDPEQKIVFVKISKTHGDRSKVADVLKAIPR